MMEPIVLEGRLRHAGDGYEWSALYLDGGFLTDRLPRLEPHRVRDFSDWAREAVEANRDDTYQFYDNRFILEDGKLYPTLMLYADLGRVRITIEQIEEA